MIKQLKSAVLNNKEILPGIHLLTVDSPQIAQLARPGQFVMVQCGKELTLRRPLSIHKATKSGHITFFFSEVGKGTFWLANCQKGDKLDLLGPLGNGFTIDPIAEHLLLVAGGVGIAPLAFLALDALAQKKSVTLIAGARTSSGIYPETLLDENLKLEVTTEDGSLGMHGLVTDLLSNHIDRSDQVFACGPLAMYQSMASIVQKRKFIHSVQVSLEVRMGCGINCCYGCSIKTKQGMKQVCQDGPIFNFKEVLWQEIKL